MGLRGVLLVRLWEVKILWVWIMGVTLVSIIRTSAEHIFFTLSLGPDVPFLIDLSNDKVNELSLPSLTGLLSKGYENVDHVLSDSVQ